MNEDMINLNSLFFWIPGLLAVKDYVCEWISAQTVAVVLMSKWEFYSPDLYSGDKAAVQAGLSTAEVSVSLWPR